MLNRSEDDMNKPLELPKELKSLIREAIGFELYTKAIRDGFEVDMNFLHKLTKQELINMLHFLRGFLIGRSEVGAIDLNQFICPAEEYVKNVLMASGIIPPDINIIKRILNSSSKNRKYLLDWIQKLENSDKRTGEK